MTNEYNPDGKEIRFIDSHYKDLFHIPDGSCVQIHYPDETVDVYKRQANGCSASTTRKRNSTTRRKNLSMPKSCCRPMRRPDMQTGQRSGTP